MIKKDLFGEALKAEDACELPIFREDIRKQVCEIIEDLCLTPIQECEQTLIENLCMDSLRMVMMLVTLEEAFEIELDESDMNPFALVTVNDVINLVMKYVSSEKEVKDHV